MANKIVVEVDLDTGDTSLLTKKIEKESKKAGEAGGKKLADSFGKESESRFSSIGKKLSLALAGVAAIKVFASSLSVVTDAAKEQEDAVNSLNNALRTSNDFSLEASSKMQSFASELQMVTRFGDEAILNQLALAKSFGATNEQATQIVTAAADLSAAMGISLDSAVRNVAKTLGGLSGELGEVIPSLKNLSQEALKSGEGIDLVAKRFSGAAKRDVAGYSGSVDQASNSFGDLLEEIGFFITKNDAFIGAINLANSAFSGLANTIKIVRKDFLGIGAGEADTKVEKLNQKLSELTKTINLYVDKEKSIREGFFGIVLNRDVEMADNMLERIKRLRAERSELIKQRADALNAAKKEREENEKTSQSEQENLLKSKSARDLFAQSQIQTEQMILEQQSIRMAALNELRSRDLLNEQEYEYQKQFIQQDSSNKIQEIKQRERDAIIEMNRDVVESTLSAFSQINASTVQLGKSITDLAIRGFGAAARNIGAALASGKNANQAFVDSVKNTASEAASAFGDYYIKLGIARIAASYGTEGYTTLAGGLALKAFSGALGVGGASSSGGAGSVNSGGFTAPFQQDQQELASPTAIERAKEQTQLNITIEGSLVRQDELGGYISEILEESGARRSSVIPSLRTAVA
ncbi:MAG: hypothetical protein KDH96_06190 [Candidatus Riesia sp.]|nr:hypothetical protein [Candidatus Riesia sp.]